MRRTSLYHPGVREDKDGRSARSGLASINFIDPHPSHTPLHAHPSTSQHIPPPFPFPPMTSRYLLACAPSPSRIPCTLVAPCDVSMVSCADRRPVDQLLPALCAVGRVTGLYYRPQRCAGGKSRRCPPLVAVPLYRDFECVSDARPRCDSPVCFVLRGCVPPYRPSARPRGGPPAPHRLARVAERARSWKSLPTSI